MSASSQISFRPYWLAFSLPLVSGLDWIKLDSVGREKSSLKIGSSRNMCLIAAAMPILQ